MTQSSRPQAENLANYPTGDSGPYSGDDWSELFQTLFTGDQEATQGPLVRYLNELAISDDGALVTVASGAGFCYGHWFISSAAVVFNPSNVAREDRVVLVENNTNTAYSLNLEFPTVLADYNGTASVEPWSCRLAILTGTGPGAPRALVNAGGIHMILLSSYDIDGGGNITGLTDEREFCFYSSTIGSRYLYVPCQFGWNVDLGGEITPDTDDGFALPDDDVTDGNGTFVVPTDFRASLHIQTHIRTQSAGNCYCRSVFDYGACSEDYAAHSDQSGAMAATPIVDGLNNCILDVLLDDASVGDIVDCRFARDGTNGLDTVGDVVYLRGWVVNYEAKS